MSAYDLGEWDPGAPRRRYVVVAGERPCNPFRLSAGDNGYCKNTAGTLFYFEVLDDLSFHLWVAAQSAHTEPVRVEEMTAAGYQVTQKGAG